MINEKTIAKCKDGVRFINCARGGIIDEDALVQSLDSGKAAGAAFDVYVTEPPEFNGPFIQHPKIVTTPHLGASTEEAQEKLQFKLRNRLSTCSTTKALREL